LHKKVGDAVKADEIIVELETDKVTLEVNAPSNGVISELKVSEGANVKVGDLIALMQAGSAATVVAKENSAAEKKSDVAANVAKSGSQHLSPAPQKLVTENNIDVSKIAGTGKDGRVTKGDVLEVMAGGGRKKNASSCFFLLPSP